MRHKLKNLLFSLEIDIEQQNYNRVKKRCCELLGDLKRVEQKSYTGISLIDAMLSYKTERLREWDASLKVSSDGASRYCWGSSCSDQAAEPREPAGATPISYTRVRADWTEALRLNPNNATARNNLEILRQMGQ
ncbi:MAG: hypothetical protein LBT14_06370 [Treponema sp.]|nr:hypothetical protein [Treponema sp.]